MSGVSRTFEIVGVEDDSDRAVIDEVYVHHGAELSGGDLHTMLPEFGVENIIELFAEFGPGGFDETGATPFATVGVKGELGDGQDVANRVEDGAVHFAVVVIEYAEVDGLAGQEPGVLHRIVFGYADDD